MNKGVHMVKDSKIAFVTGASRGIGRAIAIQLAQDGYSVAVHYSANKTAALATVATINDLGQEAFTLQADFSTMDGVQAAIQEFKRVAGDAKIDVLVNNAGIGTSSSFDATSEEEFDKLFAVNVKAPFFLTQQLLPLLQDGGSIINISSGVTRIAYPQIMAYNLTKGAINTFTLHLAALLGERNIRVNAVMPGIVDTDVNASWLHTDEGKAYALSMTTLKRIGQPNDIADVVSFLSSDKSSWITGQMIDVTGGAHL